MRTFTVRLGLVLVALLILGTFSAAAQEPTTEGTLEAISGSFTYQGLLEQGGSPANGVFDFEFRLYSTLTGGSQIGATVTRNDVQVDAGLFSVQLNFGLDAFDGNPRYLQVAVRPGSSSGAYAALTPRSEVTAAPYALFSTSTGALQGNAVSGASPSSGQVLKWNGSEWAPAADEHGSSNGGGGGSTPAVNPLLLRPVFARTSVDTAGDVGQHAAVTIGSDGMPVIAYYDNTNKDLKLGHCADIQCSKFDPAPVVLDSAGIVGQHASLAIGSDGFPIVAYYDTTNDSLNLVHCTSIDCSTRDAPVFIDSTGNTGQYTAIAISSNGRAVISYYSTNGTQLMVASCDDVPCTTASTTALDGVLLPNVGIGTSIAVGIDGFPIITYYDFSGPPQLLAIKCTNATCSSFLSPPAVLDTGFGPATGFVGGFNTSVVIGADGLPLVAYFWPGGDNLTLIHCNDIACATSSLADIDLAGDVGRFASLAIGPDELGLISYYDATNGDLKVAHCADTPCTTATVAGTPLPTVVDATGDVGRFSSLTIGVDGFGLIAYYDNTNKDLKVLHCSNRFCTPFVRAR